MKVNLTWSQAMPLFIETIKINSGCKDSEAQLMALAKAYDDIIAGEKPKRKYKKRKLSKRCQFCNGGYKNVQLHERHCKSNPNRVPHANEKKTPRFLQVENV